MKVLIVDDHPANLTLLSHLVKRLGVSETITFENPVLALDWCHTHQPDMVLLDYMMPVMDGLQFLQHFRALPFANPIPVIMITADTESDIKQRALDLSATDFLNKPIDKSELTARVRNLLDLQRFQKQLSNQAAWLTEEVKKATQEIQERESEIILRLSKAAEYRDPETGYHIYRMAHFAALIAKNMGFSEAEQTMLLKAAPMHDVGKMGIPDHILLKPGRLTPEELVIMRRHAQIGAKILEGSQSPLLQLAAQIALTHHERIDGQGYPNGLRGNDIPVQGRITAVADVFDALTSQRPYKPGWPLDKAVAYLKEHAGTHFDPACVAAFLLDWDSVLSIRDTFKDAP